MALTLGIGCFQLGLVRNRSFKRNDAMPEAQPLPTGLQPA
jgi:hypothetical protein